MLRRHNPDLAHDGPSERWRGALVLAELAGTETGSFVVGEGERVVVLGASGAGKTYLLRQLLGLARPLTSRRGSPLAAVCAYVPESDGVFLDLNVLDNVRQPSKHVRGVSESEARDWLDLVGLSSLADRPAGALSTASRRRVSLARALSRRAPLLVIDGDLDGTLRPLLPMLLECVPHLSSVVTAGCVVDDVAVAADSVALVDDRRFVAQAPLSELQASANPRVKSVLSWVTP